MANQSQAPSKAIITSVGTAQSGGTASSSKPVITGTADAGTTINVYDGVRLIGTSLVAANGSWSFTPTTDLKGGSHQFTVISVLGDNWGASSDQFKVTVPTSLMPPAPPVMTGVIDSVGPIQGPVKPNGTTDDPRPAMTGTGTAGDTIKLYDNGALIGSGTVAADGTWNIKPTADLANGPHDVYATETNAAGTSGESAHTPFKVDTTTPSTPIISGVTDNVGPITGPIPPNGTTDDPRPTINGKGDAGDTVTLYDGDKVIGSTTVAPDGTWTIKPTADLPNGPHDIHATETNAAGVPSADSAHTPFSVDTGTPAAPVISNVQDNVGPVTGPIVAGSTTDDPRPVISGTGKAGDIIKLYDGGTMIGSATVGTDGKWSIKPSADLSNAAHSLTATDTNLAGTTGPASTAFNFTVDTTVPPASAPVISSIVDAVGPVQGNIPNHGYTDDQRPVVTGTGIPGDTVYVFSNNQGWGDTVVDATGHWSVQLNKDLSRSGTGELEIHATQFASGQAQSAPSNSWYITPVASSIDKPAAPIITDNGSQVPNGGTMPDGHPTISGTGTAGDIIKVLDNGNVIGSTTIGTDGKWSFKPSTDFPAGTNHSITVIESNPAGVVSPTSNATAVTVEAAVAPVPTIDSVIDAVGPVTGAVANGGYTDDTQPTVKGTGVPGDTIFLTQNGKSAGITTVDATGHWSIKIATSLGLGDVQFKATQAATAQATSDPSNPWNVHVVASSIPQPPAPVITDNGSQVPNGGTMPDGHPAISGTGTAGDVIKVLDNGTVIGSTTIGTDGKWSFTPSTDFPAGTGHSITVIESNPAGVVSPTSNATVVTVQTAVAPVPTIDSVIDAVGPVTGAVANGGYTDDTQPTVKGTGVPGNTIYLYQNGVSAGATTVDATGHWSIKVGTSLAQGDVQFKASQISDTQSGSGPSNPWNIHVVASSIPQPPAPIITDNGSQVPNGGTMPDGHPAISGAGTAGDVIKVYDNGNVIGSTTIGTDGKWSFTPSTDLSGDTAHAITVIESNPAGVVSPTSNATSVTVVTGPHETVTITDLIDDMWNTQTSVPQGGSTFDTSPILKGTISSALLANETLVVYRDGVKMSGNATVVGTSWSYNDANVPVGTHTYTARVENTGGQPGTTSNAFTFTEQPASAMADIYVEAWSGVSSGGNYARFSAVRTYMVITAYQSGKQVDVKEGWESVDWSGPFPPSYYFVISVSPSVPTRLNVVPVAGMYGSQLNSYCAAGGTAGLIVNQSSFPPLLPEYATGVKATYTGATDDSTHLTSMLATDTTHGSSATTQHDPSVTTEHHTVVGEHDGFKGTAGGNETVDLNADPMSYFKETTAHIEGAKGGAIDTLHLTGDHQILDLTSLTGQTAAAKISGIEVIDLGGHANTLKLSLVDVLNLGETDLFQQDGKQQLMVKGADGDKVDLSNMHIAGVADGNWEQHGTTQVGGVTYNVYEHSGAHTELLIQQGVQIVVH